MKIELISKKEAIFRYNCLKDIAFSIAEANGTLPGYCESPECLQFMAYAGLLSSGMRDGEVCVFIDEMPAQILTDLEITSGKRIIGKIFAENIADVKVKNDTLIIKYADGVEEHYKWLSDLECWKFDKNNVKNVKLAQRGHN